MEHKATQDKLRKSNLDFKRRRAQLHSNKLKTDSNKEAKEGSMYQSNIGLNLDPNKTNKVANKVDVNIKVSKEELQHFGKILTRTDCQTSGCTTSFKRKQCSELYNL